MKVRELVELINKPGYLEYDISIDISNSYISSEISGISMIHDNKRIDLIPLDDLIREEL